MPQICRICDSLATKRCECSLASYCSEEHASADWKSRVGHRSECTLRVAKCVECTGETRERSTPVDGALDMPVCGSCVHKHPYVYFAADKCPLDKKVASALGETLAVQEPNGVWRINSALIQGNGTDSAARTEGFKQPSGKRPKDDSSSSSTPAPSMVVNDLIAEVAAARTRYHYAFQALEAAKQRVLEAENAEREAARKVNEERQAVALAVKLQETRLIALLQQSARIDNLSVAQFATIMNLLSIGTCVRALAGGGSLKTTVYREPGPGSAQLEWLQNHADDWLAARTPVQLDEYFHNVYNSDEDWNQWDLLMIKTIAESAGKPATAANLALTVALQLAWMITAPALYPRMSYDQLNDQIIDQLSVLLAGVLSHPGIVALSSLDAARDLVPELDIKSRYNDAVWPPAFVLAACVHESELLPAAVTKLRCVSVSDRLQNGETGMATAMLFCNVPATEAFAQAGDGANTLDGETLTRITVSDRWALLSLEAYFKYSDRVSSVPFLEAVRHQIAYASLADMRRFSRAILGVDVNTNDVGDAMLSKLVAENKWRKVKWWVETGALKAVTPWGSELYATILAEQGHYKELQYILERMQPTDTYDAARFVSPVVHALLTRNLLALKTYARFGHFPLLDVPMTDSTGVRTTTTAYAARLGAHFTRALIRPPQVQR